MVLKIRNTLKIMPSLHTFMEEESIIVDELISFTSNIRKEVCVVRIFPFFLEKI